MRRASVIGLLWVGLLSGCAHYHYFARKPNADGQGHEALASWSVTERALWFDTSSETVRVTVQCGRTIPFQQREGGVYVLHDPSIWTKPRDIGGGSYCGQVLGVTTLDEVGTGEDVTLDLWCEPLVDDEEFTIPAPALPPGQHVFKAVRRSENEPAVARCSDTPPPTAAPTQP